MNNTQLMRDKMNNVWGQTPQSGGNARKSGALALISIICFLLSVFSGCDNGFNPPGNDSHAKKGYGKVSVNLTDGAPATAANAGRTAFPSAIFSRYVYTFTKEGETEGMPKTPDNEGYFTLEAGNYTVAVQAYIGDGDSAPAATGTSGVFSVSSGADASVTVTLSPKPSTGEGTFSYAVTGPDGAAISVSLQKWPDGAMAPLQPEAAAEGNMVSQTLQLDDGIYLLTVSVNKGDLYAGTIEIVHIYPSMETRYEKAFADGDLIDVTLVSIGDYEVGNLTQFVGSVTAVTVTAREGKSPGAVTVYYEGTGGTAYVKSTSVPTAAGTYAVTFDVAAATGWKAAAGLAAGTLTIDTLTYGISLSKTGTHTFDLAAPGYTAAPDAFDVTITNTGNQATGALTAALSGTNGNSFTLSKTTIDSIAVSGADTFTVRPNAGLAEAAYTATVTVSGGSDITAQSFDVSFTVASYVITGSDSSFTATRAGVTIGAVGQPIQTVINAVRTDAAGNAATVQFGDGTTVLNIGSASASFNNTGGTWGAVTLTGKITGSNDANFSGTIVTGGGVSVTSEADIENIVNNSNSAAVYHNSTGTFTVSGGTVSAANARAVYNNFSGTVNISGGTVQAPGTSGKAVYNYSGTVNISGGTVSSMQIEAVDSRGTVNISGGTVSSVHGKAVYNSSGTVNISGGTVQAPGTSIGGVVHNLDSGTLTISGGTVQATATTGYAVYHNSTGAVTLDGSPDITGTMWFSKTGALNAASGFAPGSKEYYLEFASLGTETAVAGGGAYIANFILANSVVGGLTVSMAVEDGDIVLQSTEGYTVSKSGTTYVITKGAGGSLLIQGAIDRIKTQSGGGACTIQFGEAGTPLDIGGGTTMLITFDGWTGTVTLTGNLTYATTSYDGVIRINSGSSIDSTATFTTTGSYGYLFYNNGGTLTISDGVLQVRSLVTNNSSGTVNISGGTVSASYVVSNDSTGTVNISGGTVSATSRAVSNNSTGTVSISGGTVSATTGRAVYNHYSGTVNISGGTVSATTGQAVNNNSTGKITVSQAAGATTLVTSANTNTSQGTILLANSGTATGTRLEITGGTVENTSTGIAINNASTGAVIISGGTVSATTGRAVYIDSTGKVTVSQAAGATTLVTSANITSNQGTIYLANSGTATDTRLEITGGTVENTANSGGNAIYNYSTGAVIISGGMVSATTGSAVYNYSTGGVTISGGTVSATTGQAVYTSYGKVTVSGTANITSVNTNSGNGSTRSSAGTVYIRYGAGLKFEMTGGTVSNTSTGDGVAIMIDSNTGNGIVATITGGTVSKTNGTGVSNNCAVNINTANTATIESGATINGGRVN
jgi:hypothetical protein